MSKRAIGAAFIVVGPRIRSPAQTLPIRGWLARAAGQLLLVCATFGCAPPTSTEIRVATWNVENLFNDRRDSPELAREHVESASVYAERLTSIARALRELQADVVVLQEVENEQVTAELAAASGTYPHHVTSRGNDPRGIDIAVLSRWPIVAVRSHANEALSTPFSPERSFSFARDCLEVVAELELGHAAFLGVHFKSASDSDSRLKRHAEASRVRELARSSSETVGPVVVLGDFNDPPGSTTVSTLTEVDPSGFALRSAGQTLPRAERYTAYVAGRPELIDDQLLSPAVELLGVEIPRAGFDQSDHWPVVSRLRVSPNAQ